MGASYENGIEVSMIYDKPINSESYCKAFSAIQSYGANWVLFGDNASYHKSKETNANLRGMEPNAYLI